MKQAVISLGVRELLSPLSFKRALLLFDKVIVEKSTFELTQAIISLIERVKGLGDDTYFENMKLIEDLQDKEVLELRPVNSPITLDFTNYISSEDVDELGRRVFCGAVVRGMTNKAQLLVLNIYHYHKGSQQFQGDKL